MIFRGKGQVSVQERASYDNRVVVIFQSRAWADRKVCNEWIDKVLAPAISMNLKLTLYIVIYFILEQKPAGERLLIMDSLDGQTSDVFKEKLANVYNMHRCFYIFNIIIIAKCTAIIWTTK
jgi:hypothetical protein